MTNSHVEPFTRPVAGMGWRPGEGSAYDYLPAWMDIPQLYTAENHDDPLAVVKLFTPDTNWTWYVLEYDGDDTLFGLVVGHETELGYFSLSELRSAKGPMGLRIERDLWFRPVPITDVPDYQARWGEFGGPYRGALAPQETQPDDSPDAGGEAIRTHRLTFGDDGERVYFEGESYLAFNPYLERDGRRYGEGWAWYYRSEVETDGAWRCLPDPDIELPCIGGSSLKKAIVYAECLTGVTFELVGAPDNLPDSYPLCEKQADEAQAPEPKKSKPPRRKLPTGIPGTIEVDLGYSKGWATAAVERVQGRWLHYRLAGSDERGKVQLIGRDILWRPATSPPA